MFNFKKAAMFGLDARIALAIFGALSVISGAALYSAIAEAKYQANIQELTETTKAVEAYYLDTGSQLPKNPSGEHLSIGDLVVNRESLTQWNGPYISKKYEQQYCIHLDMFKDVDSLDCIYYILLKNSTWDALVTNNYCAQGGADCASWYLAQAKSASGKAEIQRIFNELDERIDGSDGVLKGNIRLLTVGVWLNLHIKSLPLKFK